MNHFSTTGGNSQMSDAAKRQFSLRSLIVTQSFVAVLLVSVMAAWTFAPLRPVIVYGLLRGVVVVIAGLFGWAIGRNLVRSMLGASVGILTADFFLLAGLTLEPFHGEESILLLVLNPLLVMTLIIAPVAACQHRRLPLAIGCLLSIVLPTILAAVLISRLPGPPARGTGLASVVFMVLAFSLSLTGLIGTIAAYVAGEKFDRWQAGRQSRKEISQREDTAKSTDQT